MRLSTSMLFIKTIKMGDEDPVLVGYLCELLRAHGSTIKDTDKFTIGVKTAVKAFQKKNGLEETGIVDRKTWRKLKAKK